MLVSKFKFKRTEGNGGFNWYAVSEVLKDGEHHFSFAAVGKTLSDVKEFAALVRHCANTGKIEELSAHHPKDYHHRWQSVWGGCMYPNLK